MTREWRRILTPTGSLCVELGDTYSGSGGAGGDYDPGGHRDGEPKFDGSARRFRDDTKYAKVDDGRPGGGITNLHGKVQGGGAGWPLSKSLCLIPSLYAGSLAYGWNLSDPLATVQGRRFEPWRVRNLIVWHRPNPPVGALGDKVRPSTSYVTVACTAKDRWFDLDSERTPYVRDYSDMNPTRNGRGREFDRNGTIPGHVRDEIANPAGAPPLDCWFEDRLAQSDEPIHDDAPDADVWTIPTAPYAGSHYATFPPALPRRLINLMCPRQVCTSCGEPRRRITSVEYEGTTTRRSTSKATASVALGVSQGHHAFAEVNPIADRQTLGWSDCGHNTWRRGIVCDPFCGSGTTLQAASELGRDSIGLDLDSRNLELARQRLGMFLVEEDEVVA